jgi:hypothetical protein
MRGITERALDQLTQIRQLSMQLVQLPESAVIAWNHDGWIRCSNGTLESRK